MEGNQMKMRDVLEEISSVSPGNLKEPIDGDSSNLYQDARYEGDKFVGVALPAWVAVDWYRKLKAVKEKAESALTEPPRQCDVGTPEEQYKRYSAFTSRWTPCSFNGHARCAGDCPVNKKLERDGSGDLQCPFVWAQMPYAEEGAVE